ncbi:MAG: lamin tail domain-containing protein [Candidatus Odinarchaeota archaeon]
MQHVIRVYRRHFLVIFSLTVILGSCLNLYQLIQESQSNETPESPDALITDSPSLEDISQPYLVSDPLKHVLEDLGIDFQNITQAPPGYEVVGKLRDNVNDYLQVWTPWLTRAGVHVAEVSDDGEFLVIGGGYLLDTELHVYRWNPDERMYLKVWEAGSEVLTRDVYDVAFGDSDGNGLVEVAAASADGRVYLFEQAHIIDPVANLENKFDFVWKSDYFFQVSSVEFHDLDLDGEEDLVIGSWDKKIHVFEYTDHSGYPFEPGHWIKLAERWASPEMDEKVQSLATGDFNGNGLPDVVAGTFSGSLYIFENDGIVVTTSTGVQFPFANDNHYNQIWNASGDYHSIWRPVFKIEAGDLDGSAGTEAVLLVPGQGAWVLDYSDESGFYLEKIIRAFESWQMQEPYPLDNYADWMVEQPGMNWNVFHYYDDIPYEEPSFQYLPINMNTAVMGPPDDRYSEFETSSGIRNATGTWNFGKGEELSSNGNANPDLYIVMGDPLPDLNISEWNISLSNDLTSWYKINLTDISIVTGSMGSSFAIDVDPLFVTKKVGSMQYIRLTLLGEGRIKSRKVDAIVAPYVARPVTIAASLTIDQLTFSYGLATPETDKIIFGGTDGRLLAFNYTAEPVIVGQYSEEIGGGKWEFTNRYKDFAEEYGMNLPKYIQEWDSYTDDFYTLGETIWSVQQTPKETFIPSWRYNASSIDSSLIQGDIQHLSITDVDAGFPLSRVYNPGNELIVTSDSTPVRIYAYDSSATYLGPYNSLSVTYDQFYHFNYYAERDSNEDGYYDYFHNKLITTLFADIYDNDGIKEMIIFPWNENLIKSDDTFEKDLGIMPLIAYIKDLGSGWYRYYPAKHHPDYDTEYLDDVDKQIYNFLSLSTTYPSATSADIDHDGDIDIAISNGRMVLLRNIGNVTDPQFKMDDNYFNDLNERAPPNPIFSPQFWDYDQDGDFDLAFSYGKTVNKTSGEIIDQRYGMDFFENQGSADSPHWVRKAEVFKNPATQGSLRFNNFTAGVVVPSNSLAKSAEALWVYNPVQGSIRELFAEVGTASSFIIGTNPELLKLEVNKLNDYGALDINMGFSMMKSWSNSLELEGWTKTLSVSYHLDGDDNGEIVVADFDNNVYVFEHLVENTYKIAYKTQDLNHTLLTDYSPYAFQELEGIPGTFERTIYDHGNLLATGVDYNNNGLEEFVITAGPKIYLYEATGFNDEFNLIHEIDYGDLFNITGQSEFSTLAVTPDLDGRGTMLALSAGNMLFLLRYDPVLGWLESFQPLEGGNGFYSQVGNPAYSSDFIINALLFADINQDKITELWVGGSRQSYPDKGFLVALQSDHGNVHGVYDFTGIDWRINALATVDSDYDGLLELVIGHAKGVDVWEAEKGSIFDLSRVAIISSDPLHGTEVDVNPVYGTYQSPEGLAPRSNDIHRLNNGKYFTVHGIEKVNHDPDSDTSRLVSRETGDGMLYYDVVANPEDSGSIMQKSLFATGYETKVLITEVVYERWVSDALRPDLTWIEIYNPNNFEVDLTGYQLANGTDSFYTFSGAIGPGGYIVMEQGGGDYGWGSYVLNRFGDAVRLVDDTENEIDSVSWGNVNGWDLQANDTSLVRNSTTLDGIGLQRPRDTDSAADWHDSGITDGPSGDGPYQPYELPWQFDYTAISTAAQSLNYYWISGSGYHTYQLIPFKRTWLEAKADCEARGGHLVTISSSGENTFVRNTFAYGWQYVWIGLSDLAAVNTWRWVTYPAESLVWSNWNTGEPNYLGAERYVHMYPTSSTLSGKWNNLGSGSCLYYVCEWDYPKTFSIEELTEMATLGNAVEYRPAVTQLDDGTVFVSWISNYRDTENYTSYFYEKYSKCVLGRLFSADGTPLTGNLIVDTIVSDTGNMNQIYTTITSVGVTSTGDSIIIAYSADDPIQSHVSKVSGDTKLLLIDRDDLSQVAAGNYSSYFIPVTDISSRLKLGDYFVYSLDLTSISDGAGGLVFSGYSRASMPDKEIFFVSTNGTFHREFICQISSGAGQKQFPNINSMEDNTNRLAVLYERLTGGTAVVVSVFSRNGGSTWSNEYALDTNDPHLIYLPDGSIKTELTLTDIYKRQVYNPRVTDDGTGGIVYQFTARFLLPDGIDANYPNTTGDLYYWNNYAVNATQNYVLASNVFTGIIGGGNWFRFEDIMDVRAIATGDSDNDKRLELFLSHDYRVSLVEALQEPGKDVSFEQVWQYEPPAFISLHPELVNSSYVEYLVSGTEKRRETGAVAIFDSNGNGWPELIFTVQGGDVFAFEASDLTQPVTDLLFITEDFSYSNSTLVPNATGLLITEVLYDPPGSPEERWIEICNPTGSSIVLTGLKLTIGSSTGTVSLTGSLLPGEFLIIAKHGASFQALYPGITPDLTWDTMNFDPSGDTLYLQTPLGRIVDSVSWGNKVPGQQVEANGTSIWRLSLADTDSYLDWEDSESLGDPGSGFYTQPSDASDNLLVDVNGDGLLDLIIADSKYGNGITAWNLVNDSLLWQRSAPGETKRIYLLNNSLTDPVIIGITTKGVIGVNLNGSARYWIAGKMLNTNTSHVPVDLTGDSLPELVIATVDDIRAINPFSGNVIWISNTSNTGEGYFDLAAGKFGDTVLLAVSSSDFTSFKNIHIISSDGTVIKSIDITQNSTLDTNSRSVMADFTGDGILDIAIAAVNGNGENWLLILDSSKSENDVLDVLFSTAIPAETGVDFSSFAMYARDVNNDSVYELILPVASFEQGLQSAIFPSTGKKSAIFAIDAGNSVIRWTRYFDDELTGLESVYLGTDELLFAYTSNSGIFVTSTSGSDVLWVTGAPLPAAASIAREPLTGNTIIAVTFSNGTGPVSAIAGVLEEAKNAITAQPFSVATKTEVLYSCPETASIFTIPVVMANDGTEKLLVAYTNGTLILRSFDSGELLRIKIAAFSSISAEGLKLGPGKYGLAFKTDTSNLFIIEQKTAQLVANVTTAASIVTSFTTDDVSDVLLLQKISGSSSTLSIFDPVTGVMTWSHSSPAYFTHLSVGSFDALNPEVITHVFAIDYLGEARLIELPVSMLPGGTFSGPGDGGNWILGAEVENNDSLSDVYLFSSNGELKRHRWLADGSISSTSYSIDPATMNASEMVSIEVKNQGEYNDVLLNSIYQGSAVLRDNGASITVLSKLNNLYTDSYDDQLVNVNGDREEELVVIAGNTLIIMSPETGTGVTETHSLPSELTRLTSWTVDVSQKAVLVGILKNGEVVIVDPSGRKLGSQNEIVQDIDLRSQQHLSSNQDSTSSQNSVCLPGIGTGTLIPGIIILFPVLGLTLLLFTRLKRWKGTTSDRRRN